MRKDETVLENGGGGEGIAGVLIEWPYKQKWENGRRRVTKSEPIYWAEYEKKPKNNTRRNKRRNQTET